MGKQEPEIIDNNLFCTSIEESDLDRIAPYVLRDDVSVSGFHLRKPLDYQDLLERTSFLSKTAHIKERFWHLFHKTSIKPECALTGCYSKTNWHRIKRKHNICCSRRCAKIFEWQNIKKNSNNYNT